MATAAIFLSQCHSRPDRAATITIDLHHYSDVISVRLAAVRRAFLHEWFSRAAWKFSVARTYHFKLALRTKQEKSRTSGSE